MRKFIKAFIFTGGLMIFSVATSLAQTEAKGIKFFSGTWQEALKKASEEKKLIFMDAYTTWCGPCKWMAANVFTNDTVAEYFNKNFVNVKMDMEKGEGIEIAKKYEVRCYPNLLFIDGTGTLVHRAAGSRRTTDFIALGKDAYTPEKTFSALKKKYDDKNRDPKFIHAYLDVVSRTCLDGAPIAAEYFMTQKESDLMNRNNWEIIRDHVSSSDAQVFKYLVDHYGDYSSKYTADSVTEKINEVYIREGSRIIYSKKFEQKQLDDFIAKVEKLNYAGKDEIVFNTRLTYYQKLEDYKNYSSVAVAGIEKFFWDKPYALNGVAWDFYEHLTDKVLLEKALGWARRAIQLDPQWVYYDTYAALHFKLGNKNEALEACNKAISIAQAQGEHVEEYGNTMDLLEKIKKMK